MTDRKLDRLMTMMDRMHGDMNKRLGRLEDLEDKRRYPPVSALSGGSPRPGANNTGNTFASGLALNAPDKQPGGDEKGEEDEEEEDFWDLGWKETTLKNLLWLPMVPLVILFKVTIPRADRKATENYFWVAFAMAILWIGLLSMYMLKFASWCGAICSIHATVMGLVVVAAGTSVPDAMGSYFAAKMGNADMAVSNALGSNVFNIFAGLGIPWLISALVKGKPILVPIDGIIIPVCILFFVLGVFIYTLWRFKLRLEPMVGKIFITLFLCFTAYNLLNAFVINPDKGDDC